MEGQADVDRLATSVRAVSGATSLASDGLASLEKSIGVLTAAVTENTAALSGMEGGFDRAAGGATRLAGGARAVTAELKMMEGAMPIRAAAQFLTQFEGLNKVMQMAFPLFGAIALVGVLDQIIEKVQKWVSAHDPLTKAQTESLSLLKESTKEYDRLREKLHALTLDEYERAHGRDARLRLEASEKDTKAQGPDAHNIARLENYARVLREVSQFKLDHPMAMGSGDPTMAMAAQTPVGGTQLTERQASLLKAAGMEGQLMGDDKAPNPFENVRAGHTLNQGQIDAAQNLLTQGISPELETARMRQKVDSKSASDDNAKVDADEKKKAQEAAAKRARELAEAEKQAASYLRQAQNFELTGLARINAVYHEKLELLGKTKKAIQDINAAYAIEVGRELDHIQKDNRKNIAGYVSKMEQDADKSDAFGAKQFLANLKKQLDEDKKAIESGLKVLQASDNADADAVRRSLGVTLKGNDLAARGGRISGGAAAGADYDARVAAAGEIFRIETQHLDLIDDKNRREEKLASARKKWADDIYRAEEQYEIQLQTLREKDLQKYQGMAGSLFDALHSHSIGTWLRGEATKNVRQMFVNVATPALQQAGHVLGSVTGGNSFGGLLNGTILDPKNSDASTTAKQTTRTAEAVEKLRVDIRAMIGAPAPTAGDAGGAGINYSPLKGTGQGFPLDVLKYGSDITGGWGSSTTAAGSSLFNAGNGSGFGQFFSGLTGMGSNPLGAIFTGMSTNGSTVTQLTTAQQVGAAVGTAAMLAGAGMSIASGISQGGVGGYTKAASAGLGAAAMLDPEPVSKMVLGTVAAVTGIIGSLFGTGPQQRSKDIAEYLAKNQYLAPTALNVMQGMNGRYEDFDARGNLRTSSMSAVPTVAEPYITSRVIDGQRQYYNVPGQVTTPYSGGSSGTGQSPIAGGMNVIIQAFDSESLHEYLQKPANTHAVGEALASHLERHDGRASNAIRYITGS